jgi:hypothetical protein
MIRITYTARLKNHKSWSIQGIAYGETIKRFQAVVLNRNPGIDFICVESQVKCNEEEAFKHELKLSKRATLNDLFL